MSSTDASTRPPRAAATLVMMRPCLDGFEVLVTLRPKELRFMGGATVFPGGAVDPADLDPEWERASNLSPTEAARRLGEEDGPAALGAFVCAYREAFEEVGYLAGSGPVGAVERTPDAAAFRHSCIGNSVVLDTAALIPAGRWVTPLGSPVRFDARFFLCEVEKGFEPDPDPSEVAAAEWLTPARALVELSAGDRSMAPPTVEMLQRLDAFDSIEAAVTGLSSKGVGGSGRMLSARLSPSVHAVLAPNPGLMTGPGTNTYIVGSDPSLVIDPAVDDEEYLDAVVEASGEIAAILVTHRHPDHIGGVAPLVRRTGAPVRAWGRAPVSGIEVVPFEDGEVVRAGNVELRAVFAPGHASDHVCFVLEGAASIFAGDNILGEGTAVIAPPDGDMRAYLRTLARLEAEGADRIYTGHFRPLDGGTEVIRRYIAHRRAREEAILMALADGPLDLDSIVERVYTDVDPKLHAIARFSVLAHLQMSEEDGLVETRDDRWRLRDHK